MKTKILSTVIFSVLLFAGMYSEARQATNVNKPGVSGNRGAAPAGKKTGQGAANVRVQDVSTGQARNLAPRENRSQRGGNNEADLNQLLGVNKNGQRVETEGEVVRDVNVMRTNVAAGTNQSHRLSESFASLFSFETAVRLARVVNGTNAPLKASVLRLNEQAQTAVQSITVQMRESITWAGKLIAFVSGRSTVKNPSSQDPSARELLHDMANNAGEAVSWSQQPRSNFFAIVQKVLETRNNHPQGLAGAFRDAVSETFKLAKDKVMEKFWEIRRECRA